MQHSKQSRVCPQCFEQIAARLELSEEQLDTRAKMQTGRQDRSQRHRDDYRRKQR